MTSSGQDSRIDGPAQDPALRGVQLEELKILLEFRRLCQENGLRYYLTGGTLLGAVRHKGFIPWDDDADVVMPREDYERFAALCPAQIGPGFLYRNTANDPGYTHFFAKMGSTAQGMERAFVDIFPLDRCPDNKILAILQFKGVRLASTALMARTLDGFVCGYTRWYMRALLQVMKLFPNRFLIKLRAGICRFFGRFASGRKVCNVDGRYSWPGEVRDVSWYDRPESLCFEGEQFSVPCGWDALLTNMFGDYMTPPAEKDRLGHSSET